MRLAGFVCAWHLSDAPRRRVKVCSTRGQPDVSKGRSDYSWIKLSTNGRAHIPCAPRNQSCPMLDLHAGNAAKFSDIVRHDGQPLCSRVARQRHASKWKSCVRAPVAGVPWASSPDAIMVRCSATSPTSSTSSAVRAAITSETCAWLGGHLRLPRPA